MARIINFLTGDWDKEGEEGEEVRDEMKAGQEIVKTLTSLCNSNNCAIHFNDQIVYGMEGAVIRKEKSFKKYFNGNIGRSQ